MPKGLGGINRSYVCWVYGLAMPENKGLAHSIIIFANPLTASMVGYIVSISNTHNHQPKEKIMAQITKEMLRAIRVDMDAALVAVASKYNLSSLKAGNCTFSPDVSFAMKVSGLVEGWLSADESRYVASLFLGLPPLGFEFSAGGTQYKTFGINTTGSKVIATKVSDGKKYLFKTEFIQGLAEKLKVAA